jgi:hypothetical protein
MDVVKKIKVVNFKLFGIPIFKIEERSDTNFRENVEPIYPIVEFNLNDKYTDN